MGYTLQYSWASLVAQLVKNLWTSPWGHRESDTTERRALSPQQENDKHYPCPHQVREPRFVI